jgi:hypothetical protein
MTTAIRISRTYFGRGLVYPTAILTLGAAALHLSVTPNHLQEYLPFGVFFLVVGLAQAALAFAMFVRPSRRIFIAAALIGLGCVVLWLVSRTIGLPLGPSERLENVQLGDPLTLFLQIATANGQMAGVLTSLFEIVGAILCGLGLVAVGVFTTDPAQGFPPGVIDPTQPSWHGILHALGGLFIFLLLSAALIVFSRLFFARKERGWAFYCWASAALILVIFFGGINNPEFMARTLRLATLIGWMAASLIAIKLITTVDTAQPTRAQ